MRKEKKAYEIWEKKGLGKRCKAIRGEIFLVKFSEGERHRCPQELLSSALTEGKHFPRGRRNRWKETTKKKKK